MMMISQESEGTIVEKASSTTEQPPLQQHRRCFTSIQQHRKCWISPTIPTTVRLCPSMDLIAYVESVVENTNNRQQQPHKSSSSVVLHIHRTLTWQPIASVTSSISEEITTATTTISDTMTKMTERHDEKLPLQQQSSPFSPLVLTDDDDNDDTSDTNQMIVWSPDGRSIAVAVENSVHIYSVEGLLLAGTSSTAATTPADADGGTTHTGSTGTFLQDPTHSGIGDDSNDNEQSPGNGKVFSFSLPLPCHQNKASNNITNSIVSVSWVHIGSWCEHHNWPNQSYNTSIQLRNQYYNVDYIHRDIYVLPPSSYNYHHLGRIPPNDSDDGTITDTTAAADATTTMSLLAVLTLSGHVSLYLRGQYPIMLNMPLFLHTLSVSNTTKFHPIVASPDLTHFITATTKLSSTMAVSSTELIILSLPSLSRCRDSYEIIASLFSQSKQHMETIRCSITEIIATWKSSLKPVDLKFEGLRKLLISYGLVLADTKSVDNENDSEYKPSSNALVNHNSIRSLLVQYMLSGHTTQNTGTSTLSNAIDQFFTSVPMNDQLIQRMGITLFSTIANLESTVRKVLVAPATALVHVIDQLYGISAHQTNLFASTTGEAITCLQLLHSSQQLLLTVNMALTILIEARSRIRNLVAWLRSTGANIKARGTATNSVQRENAKKRRISESLIRQLLFYLQEPEFRIVGRGTTGFVGLTETILNLKFAETLHETLDQKENHRPLPSINNNLYQQQQRHDKNSTAMCISHALQMTSRLADVVFELPRSLLLQSMKRTTIRLLDPSATAVEESSRNSRYSKCLAMTTRLGQGGIDLRSIPFGDSPASGYFSPTTQQQQTSLPGTLSSADVMQWLVFAQGRSNLIRLHAFPLAWTKTGDDEFDEDDSDRNDGLHSKSKRTVVFRLPDDCTVRDIAFYRDDGKSTLSPVSSALLNCNDNGTKAMGCSGQEGRQSLGFLISRKSNIFSVKDESVELWLVPYDDLEYSCEPIKPVIDNPTGCVFQCRDTDEPLTMTKTLYCYTVLPMPRTDDDPLTMDLGNILHARTRSIFDAVDFSASPSSNNHSSCRLVLSGSRGIGAVLLNQNGNTSLEILDVEDDEEEEDDDMVDDES